MAQEAVGAVSRLLSAIWSRTKTSTPEQLEGYSMPCDRGDVVIVVLPVVLAECAFLPESFTGIPAPRLAPALGHLISSPGVEVSELAIHLDALNRSKKSVFTFSSV